MNTKEIEGNWNEQKGKLKQRLAILINNDLLFKEGMKDEMLRKLQIGRGRNKGELRKIIVELCKQGGGFCF